MELFKAFCEMPVAGSDKEFAAICISACRRDFLAKTPDGAPIFLLHNASASSYSPTVALEKISVTFSNSCRVVADGVTYDDQFAAISCDSSDPDLFELFVRCVAAAVTHLPVGAETRDLESCIQGLLKLFRALTRPGNREIAGIWAELFLILESGNVSGALQAWHSDHFERFDFSWPGGRLEVKATSKELRVHDFALEQLRTDESGVGFVASVLLQPISGGVGVMDLAKSIDDSVGLDQELRRKLWENVAGALGSDFCESLDRRFDVTYARRNAALFAMTDIPSPQKPSDLRITNIRFSVDISAVKSSIYNDIGSRFMTRLFA